MSCSANQQDIAALARQCHKESAENAKLLTTILRKLEEASKEQEAQSKELIKANKNILTLQENIVKLLTALQIPKNQQ